MVCWKAGQLLELSFLYLLVHRSAGLPFSRRPERFSYNGSFVQAGETQFFLNDHLFFVNGFNAYWLTYYSYQLETRPLVTKLFQEALGLGLNVVRTWAFNDGGYHALQLTPGVFDENAFKGLDFVIAEAQSYGMMLILSLSNNYNDYGGKSQYVQWARKANHTLDSVDTFFCDPIVKAYYKNYVKAVLTRVNSITGVVYRDDPTIFAWELINEPRCTLDPTGNMLQEWIQEMAAFVKSVDNNHMLQIGLEGFYGVANRNRCSLGDWAAQLGTDFIRNNEIPEIDFATVHSYPDFWLPGSDFETQLAFLVEWIRNHIEDATFRLHKPVLFTEFGKSSRTPGYTAVQRDRFFAVMYASVFASTPRCGPGAGTLLWQLLPEAVGDAMDDGFGISQSLSPTTVSLISSQSERVTALNSRFNGRR